MRSTFTTRLLALRAACRVIIGGLCVVGATSHCAAVGFHGGGGGGGGARMGGGGPMAGRGPSLTGFGGARPPSLPTARPSLPLGGPGGGFDHGAIPGFPHAAAPISRPGGGATPSQLGNFLGLPGGALNVPRPGAPGTAGGAMNLSPGKAWPAGHAGNRAAWAGPTPGAGGDMAAHIRNAVKPDGPRADQMRNWLDNNPQRAQQWKEHGDQIRQRWASGDHPAADHHVIPGSDWWSKYHPDLKDHPPIDHGVIPGSDWWSKYHPNLDNWYYHHGWNHHGWAYWWGTPTWVAYGAWFPAWGWTEPVFYDYGEGGNVVYQNENVYVNGQDVGTAAQYAQSAADLATVEPQQAQATPADEDWLALGTFAVVTSQKDSNPSRILQLAVDHQGIVSGTMHNGSSNQTYVVQGRVDKDTQRIAFTVGDKGDIVMETGLYNLTQPQTPVLVHYGTDRTENYLLVRLDPPATAEQPKTDATDAPATPNPFGS